MVGGALIDDCALARLVKGSGRPSGGKTWLGLSRDVRSLRPHNSLGRVWSMVARTAFTQLRYSPLLLAGTALGMALVYLAPPLSVAGGLVAGALGHGPGLGRWLATSGLVAWVLMVGCYLPTLKWCRVSPLFAFLLPLTAALYTLMTLDSARRHWLGAGGAWKGRTYPRPLPGLKDPE